VLIDEASEELELPLANAGNGEMKRNKWCPSGSRNPKRDR
jgi:hypothetical protein